MIRSSELIDIRKANQFADKRRKEKAQVERKRQAARYRLWWRTLLQAGIGGGWVQRW